MSARKRFLIRCFEVPFYVVLSLNRWFTQKDKGAVSEEVRKILVVEYWQLGDIVILLPFLQNLRATYPEARIALLANPKVVSIVKGQSLIDDFIPVRMPWAQHFSRWRKYNPFSLRWIEVMRALVKLQRAHFDLAFSGRMDIRDNFLLWITGASRTVGYGAGGGGFGVCTGGAL